MPSVDWASAFVIRQFNKEQCLMQVSDSHFRGNDAQMVYGFFTCLEGKRKFNCTHLTCT